MSNQSNNSLCCVPFENIFSDIVCWFELIHSGLIVRKKEQKTKEDLLHLFHDGAFARFSGPWNILKVIQRSHLTLKLKVKFAKLCRKVQWLLAYCLRWTLGCVLLTSMEPWVTHQTVFCSYVVNLLSVKAVSGMKVDDNGI